MSDRRDDEGTRGERRERKAERKRRAMRLHGASLRRIYRDVVLKRVRRRKPSDADPGERP